MKEVIARSVFAVLGLLALFAAPASAQVGHQFGFSFAGSGTNALSAPTGIAVDNSNGPSTGDVYVTDPTNHRVEKFDAAGNFVLMFGKDVDATTPGDVCPVNPGDVCQPGTPGTGAGQFSNPKYVAVDSSSGPSAGDVYVGDVTGFSQVQKFDPGGHLITSWGGSPAPGQLNKSTATNDNFSTVVGITVDPTGNLWVGGLEGNSRLFEFNQAGAPLATLLHNRHSLGFGGGMAIDPSGTLYMPGNGGYQKVNSAGVAFGLVNSTGTQSGVAVSPSSGDLFVSNGTSVNSYHFTSFLEVQSPTDNCTFFYVDTPGGEASAGCPATESFGSAANLTNASGLAVSASSDEVYVADPTAHDVAVFTQFIRPDFDPAAPTNVTTSSATVNEGVDPAGGPAITACHYEYGTEEGSYALGNGMCSPDPSSGPPASNFTTPTTVSADLSGLEVLVPYHYRFVVTTANGTTYGQDRTVRSIPEVPKVNHTSVSMVSSDSAVVRAEIDPGEGLTSYRFDYGLGTAYEFHTLSGGPIDPKSPDRIASAELPNLEPGRTYHFRIVASNFTGTTAGPDETFTTPSPPRVESTSASSIGRTSATLNALVNPGLSLTTYHFEYGTSAAYGSGTPESVPIGSDSVAHTVSAPLSGLVAGTVYHFRIVATNGIGVTNGPDETFSTSPPEEKHEEKPQPCKKGFVRRHGHCVRPKHHRRHTGGSHG